MRAITQLYGMRVALAAVLALFAAVPSQGAYEMFLQIEGIPGESQDKDHKDEIIVMSWSWGETQSSSSSTGGGGSLSAVKFQDFSFTKYIDKATPKLALYCANGQRIPSMVLTVRRTGTNPLEYLVITLEDVLVTSVKSEHGTGDVLPLEEVSFNYAKILFSYTVQLPDGSIGETVEFSWDLAANREA